MNNWYAHGKLLLAGEYLVLEGATALALPLKSGQSLIVEKTSEPVLTWQADFLGKSWFSAQFRIPDLKILTSDNELLGKRLQKILLKIRELNPSFLNENQGFSVKTELEFNPEFGFGSSSTLLVNLARWSSVDPFALQKITFGGSGYDIACAISEKPIFFQLKKENLHIEELNFKPKFKSNLFFVYLGKKQISFESIAEFKKSAVFNKNDILQISEISRQIAVAEQLEDFEQLLFRHENIISQVLNRPTIQSLLFPDFPGKVKSLGAWGGDFVLMTSLSGREELSYYLSKKGLSIFYSFDELILG